MSWFSAVSIDEQVEKATSENLPTGEQDLGLNLEICDMIRSKTVQPKDAMRSLKRRLLNKNPNVRIATLHLIDTCIKNGGAHFLQEIASREFMDSAILVLKPPSGVVNYQVQELLLEYIQIWAYAFEGQIQLAYVNKVYNQLRSEGFQFPSTNKLGSSFIDSEAPPEWVDSDTCMKSGEAFSFVNRKHHCRNCGGIYLLKYCQNYLPLPRYGINEPVRVCDDCYEKLNTKSKRADRPVNRMDKPPRKEANNGHVDKKKGYQGQSNDDEDLKRALQLSLEESKVQAPPAPQPAIQSTNAAQPEESDEDLKAAIAASLRDMENKPETPQSQPPQLQSQPQPQPQPQSQAMQAPPPQEDEFTPLEEEILYRYVQLVESLQSQPHGSILRDQKLQQLNDSVSALRPKLARTLGNSIEKYDKLVDMHGKLTTVVRFYDKMLEDRLSQTHYQPYPYQHHQTQPPPVNTATHPQYPSSPNNPFSPSAPSAPNAPSAPSAPMSPNASYVPSDPYMPSAPSAPPMSPQYTNQPPTQQQQQQQQPPKDEILIDL